MEDLFPECIEGHQEIYDSWSGETFCRKCGLVLSEIPFESLAKIELLPRKRVCGGRKRRCKKSQLTKLEVALYKALERNDVPTVVRRKAFELFAMLRRKNSIRGYTASTVANTVIYLSGRLCNIPSFELRMVDELREQRQMLRCYNRICEKLTIKVPKFQEEDYFNNLSEKMQFGRDVKELALSLLSHSKERRSATSANPLGIAAAVLYIAANRLGNKITQKEVSEMVGLSEVTIRNSSKIILRFEIWSSDKAGASEEFK